jgi:hypothetical protein
VWTTTVDAGDTSSTIGNIPVELYCNASPFEAELLTPQTQPLFGIGGGNYYSWYAFDTSGSTSNPHTYGLDGAFPANGDPATLLGAAGNPDVAQGQTLLYYFSELFVGHPVTESETITWALSSTVGVTPNPNTCTVVAQIVPTS